MIISKRPRRNEEYRLLARKYKSEYRTLAAMKQRCYNPNELNYKNYGARGITICERWLEENGFINFIKDMGKRPDKHSIDRIDNDGDYTPENCRWATQMTQVYNSRRVKMITINGRTQSISQWRRELGINHSSYYERIELGMSVVQALTIPKQAKKKLIF